MKTFVVIYFFIFPTLSFASEAYHLTSVNREIAKAAVESYSQGHYRFIQDGKIIETPEVDESKPACILETGKMKFDPDESYELLESRSLDVDADSGEIELTFETKSTDPDSFFQIYCYQATSGATIDTAREGLKGVFELNSTNDRTETATDTDFATGR
jgi:hypothetical protein